MLPAIEAACYCFVDVTVSKLQGPSYSEKRNMSVPFRGLHALTEHNIMDCAMKMR